MNLPVKGRDSINCRYVFSYECALSRVRFGIGNNQCTARLQNSVKFRNDCVRLFKGIERVRADHLVECAVGKLEAPIQVGNLKLHIGKILASPTGVSYHRSIDV